MPDQRSYQFNASLRVWETGAHAGSSYSDGADVEDHLLATLRQCQDVSTLSPTLRAHIVDWPTQYHLSSTRHNLLRPFPLGPNDRVLEFGCGCGALTRYLGETGAQVVAVEGSLRRAAIAAERCRDLPNVSVYCDNLVDFESPALFSHVTLIGVLEYAPQCIPGPDPVGRCLDSAARLLHPDGSLLLAIENQFGLKYFAGCSEDHTGQPYFGIHNRYNSQTAITFGQQELIARLNAGGFPETTLFYPFPDYKLPTLILSQAALEQPGLHVADLLPRTASRDYSGQKPGAFLEALVWPGLARNGMVGALANSFLVRARKANANTMQATPWLAACYSTQRLPEFATATHFVAQGARLEVRKTPLLSPSAPPPDQPFQHRPAGQMAHVPGNLYGAELLHLLAQGADWQALAQWLRPWVHFLAGQATRDAGGIMTLPGNCVDAIPTNMVRTPSGSLVAIDLEWAATAPIAFNWVLLRGLLHTLMACPLRGGLQGHSIGTVVGLVLDSLGHAVNDQDVHHASAQEAALQAMVFGPQHDTLPFTVVWTLPADVPAFTMQQEVAALRQEIRRVKSTVSWQVTKPLRLLANVGRWLAHRFGFLA